MIYLTRMLGKPVVDAAGETIGTISDIAIATGEIFPRVTSLAFRGPDKTPFMLSWRKFVGAVDDEHVMLNVTRPELRFSYLQPDEVLLTRDLLNKQIVDTQGLKVVRVNDLKLSESRGQLRLLGAEVGIRGLLRGIGAPLEVAAERIMRLFGRELTENIIAWNYIDLLDRDLSHVKLSVTHKRLHELHPADVADILEQLSTAQRAKVFEHLDNDQAAEAITELEDELQAEVLEDLTNQRASDILEIMDPDDAADIIGDLSYDKAETLLRLMGVKEARQVRKLLGYKEKTAGGIMTPEVTTITEDQTVGEVIDHLRSGAADNNESIYYIYTVGSKRMLTGVVSLRDLIMSQPDVLISEIAQHDLFTVSVDDDQEIVADMMSKYDLLALPVIDESGRLLGMVTVDDALDVMEEESAEDLALASGSGSRLTEVGGWLAGANSWIVAWVVAGLATAALLHTFWQWPGTFAVAVIFVPLIMRLSDEVTAMSFGRMIDPGDAGQAPAFVRRLLVDLGAGAALGIVSGLVALAVLQVMREPLVPGLAIAISLAITVLTLSFVSALLPVVLRRRDESWRASSGFVTSLMSTGAIALFMVLSIALRAAGK
ncbi:MAG: magnesium transporter [Coriobacteriia bacterium]|nr:magnesium transporter [Coriobacteriia bacterium]